MSQGGQYDLIPAMPFAGSPLKCEHTSKKLDKSESLNASRASSGIPAGLTTSSSLISEAGKLTLGNPSAPVDQDTSDSGYVKGRVAHLEELFNKLSSDPPAEGDPATMSDLPSGMLTPDATKGTMQGFSIEDQLRAAAPPRTTPIDDLTPRGPRPTPSMPSMHGLLSTNATFQSSPNASPAGLPPRAPAVGPSPMSSPLVHSAAAYTPSDPPQRATSPSPMSRPASHPLAIPRPADPSPTSSTTTNSCAVRGHPPSQTSDLERHAQARALGLEDPEDDIFFLRKPKAAAAETGPALTEEVAESTVAGSISLTPPPMSSEDQTEVTDNCAPTSAEASVTSKDINNVISDACSSDVQQVFEEYNGVDKADALAAGASKSASQSEFSGHPNTIYGRTFAFSSTQVPKLLANAAANASAFEVVKSSSSVAAETKADSAATSFPAPEALRDYAPTLGLASLADPAPRADQESHSNLPADDGFVTPRNVSSGKSGVAAHVHTHKGMTLGMQTSPSWNPSAEVSPSPDMQALRNGAFIVPEGWHSPPGSVTAYITHQSIMPVPELRIQDEEPLSTRLNSASEKAVEIMKPEMEEAAHVCVSAAAHESDGASWPCDGLSSSSLTSDGLEKMPRLPEISSVSMHQVKPLVLSDTAATIRSANMLGTNDLYDPCALQHRTTLTAALAGEYDPEQVEWTASAASTSYSTCRINTLMEALKKERTRASNAEARAKAAESSADALRRDNEALAKENHDMKVSVTHTLSQLAISGKSLVNMLTHTDATATADRSTTDSEESSNEAPLRSHQSIVRQLREVVAAAAEATAVHQRTLINSSSSSIDAGLSQSLRHKMRLTSQSPTAQPQCMHAMRDTAADADSSESSLSWTPSRSAPLSPTPSPTTHVAQPAVMPAVTPTPEDVATEPLMSINPPQTVDDSTTPSAVPTYTAAVRPKETFASVVRKNLEAAPQELITCSLQSKAPVSMDTQALLPIQNPLMSPGYVSAQPISNARETFESVLVSLTPGLDGFVSVCLQQTSSATAIQSSPAVKAGFRHSVPDGEPSSAYMTACSVGATSYSQSPASSMHTAEFNPAEALPAAPRCCSFGSPAAGATALAHITPLMSPPNYFNVKLSAGDTGLTSTYCPTTATPRLPASSFDGFQGFPTPLLHDVSPAGGCLFNKSPFTAASAGDFQANAYVHESPVESSGSNAYTKLQNTDTCDQAATVPQLQLKRALSAASDSSADEDLYSEDSKTSSTCSSDVSVTSEGSVAQKSPPAARDDAKHELASVPSSASTDSHSGAEHSPEVYTVWGTKVNEDDEVLVDALIMKQREEGADAITRGDQKPSSGAPDNYVPGYDYMQLLNERCEVFEALAEAWGNEAQISRILASTVSMPVANGSDPEQGAVLCIDSNAMEGQDAPVHDVYTANLPKQCSIAASEPSYIIGADSIRSQSMIEALPESTRSNLAQLIAERSQLYSEMAAAWGQEATMMQERTAKESAQARVNDLEMQVAALKDTLIQHGLAAPTSLLFVRGSDQILSDTLAEVMSYGAEGAAAPPADTADIQQIPEVLAAPKEDVYTATLPVKTAEQELESDRLQQQYDEEAAAAESSEEGLMDALQVLPESTRSNLAQLLKERSQLFEAIADAWGKEAEYNRACATAEEAVQCSAAMAQDVDILEYELAQRHEEASFMHKRFVELAEQASAGKADAEQAREQCEELTQDLADLKKLNEKLVAQVASLESSDVKKVCHECNDLKIDLADAKKLNEKLAAEVAALQDELETANEQVAEVESEAAKLWRTQREDRDAVCDLRMQLRGRDDEIIEAQQTSANLQKRLDEAAKAIETLKTEVHNANEKAEHREKAFSTALIHLRAAKDASHATSTMVTTDTQTTTPETSGTEECASESSLTSPRSSSGRKGKKRGSKVKGQGISNATTSRAAAAKAADAAAEERDTLKDVIEEQTHKINELQEKLESELEHQAQELPALRDQLAASVATSKAHTERIAQLESMVTKYRAEVDNLELALAAAECNPKTKAAIHAEAEEEQGDFIAAGLPEDGLRLTPETLTMIKGHGNDQELPEASQHSNALVCAQVHCTDLETSGQIAVGEMDVHSELDLLRQEVSKLKVERVQLQYAVSKAISDVGDLRWALSDGQEVENMLTIENQDLQEVVISMEKQLNDTKDQVAHLHAKEKDLRESFQMVVGDSFDLYDELQCLKGNLPKKVQQEASFTVMPAAQDAPKASEEVPATDPSPIVEAEGEKEAPKPGQKIAVLLNITTEPYKPVKVVLNQEDIALCMGEDSYDTDSRMTSYSSGQIDSPATKAPTPSPGHEASTACDQKAPEVAPGLQKGMEVQDEVNEAAATMPGDAAAQLQAKMNEVSAMLGEAEAGCDAVQGTHDMMGHLWGICTYQQAQLKERDEEVQAWKASALEAIHDTLDEIHKQHELTAANNKHKQMIEDLQRMVKKQQKDMEAHKETAEAQIAEQHAELAQAAEDLDRLQDNLQALVNENLDYQDKTQRLEAALTAANKLLASSGVAPQTVEDQQLTSSPEQPVQLVVHVSDSERARTAECRLICLSFWSVQQQGVIADLAAQVKRMKLENNTRTDPTDALTSTPIESPDASNVFPDMAKTPEVSSYLPDCFKLLKAAGSAIGNAVMESAEPAEVFGSPVSSGDAENGDQSADNEDNTEEDVKHLHHTIMDLQTEVEELTSEKQNIEGLYDAVLAQRDNLVKQVQDVSNQLEVTRKEKDTLHTHYIQLYKHAERLQQDINEKAAEVDSKKEKLVDKEGELAELRDMCESAQELNDEITSENHALAAESKELLRARGELRDQNQTLQERCATLQVMSAVAERRATAVSELLSAQVVALRKKVHSLETKLMSAKFEAQDLQFWEANIEHMKAITGELVYLEEQQLLDRECQNAINTPTDPRTSTQGAAGRGAASAPGMYVTQEMLVEEVQKRVQEALAQHASSMPTIGESEKLPEASHACNTASASAEITALPLEVPPHTAAVGASEVTPLSAAPAPSSEPSRISSSTPQDVASYPIGAALSSTSADAVEL